MAGIGESRKETDPIKNHFSWSVDMASHVELPLRPLGASGLLVSAQGLGCMSLTAGNLVFFSSLRVYQALTASCCLTPLPEERPFLACDWKYGLFCQEKQVGMDPRKAIS
jgi:hypothetical protein